MQAKHIECLPFAEINRLLGLTLNHGTVHLSKTAIQHMEERHQVDFEFCINAIEAVVTSPDYVGQSPLHPKNFVLTKEVNNVIVLVAISTIKDSAGDYPIQSAYTLDSNTTRRRLRKGYFKPMTSRGEEV